MTTAPFFLSIVSLALLQGFLNAAFISSNTQGIITALGDFNNDKYTDLVTINANSSVSVWFYKQKDTSSGSRISKEGKPDLIVPDLSGDESVVAAVPGDFNKDNALDIAVLIMDKKVGNNYQLRMFYHDSKDSKKLTLDSTTWSFRFTGQPLIADANGDQVPDFIGQIDGTLKVVHTVSVKLNSGTSVEAFKPYDFNGAYGSGFSGTLSDKTAHSFAHVIGDDQPDMVLAMTDGFQIWQGNKGEYELKATIPLPEGKVLGNAIVLDIDMDGYPELVLPMCVDASCEVSLISYYEVQQTAKEGKAFTVDRWILLHSFAEEASPKVFTTTSLGSAKLVTNNLILRAGDVDFDGYPDLLAILTVKGSKNRKLFQLDNVQCGSNKKLCSGSRGLSSRDLGLENVETATFFDYKEDGGNNLIYSQLQGDKYLMGSKDISNKGDSSFLKVMVIGGHCGPGGGGDEKCKFGQDVNYGANLPGPTIKYETQGSDGHTRKGVWTQLSQGTHQAIQPPWVIFGLGQVANFVEKLTITIASDDNIGEASMENVIPNSQLILIPYPPDKPSKWTFQLLLTPSDIIWKFAIALFSVVVVLGIIVIILQWQEKREDDAEKQEEAHKFHFDAM